MVERSDQAGEFDIINLREVPEMNGREKEFNNLKHEELILKGFNEFEALKEQINKVVGNV